MASSWRSFSDSRSYISWVFAPLAIVSMLVAGLEPVFLSSSLCLSSLSLGLMNFMFDCSNVSGLLKKYPYLLLSSWKNFSCCPSHCSIFWRVSSGRFSASILKPSVMLILKLYKLLKLVSSTELGMELILSHFSSLFYICNWNMGSLFLSGVSFCISWLSFSPCVS